MNVRLEYNLNWSEYFQLNETSPSGLVRINKAKEKISVGTKIYQKNGNPAAWSLMFRGKNRLIHRIIWAITYGSIDPTLVIDHLDGNPFNNQISNLSLKTSKNNARNKRQRINNTTGITGVYLQEDNKGNYYYTASWCELKGNRKYKLFSVNKFGEEISKALAKAYREEQIQRLILEGAEYTERHGL